MSYQEFLNETRLDHHVIAVTRITASEADQSKIPGCIFKNISKVFEGETLILGPASSKCPGFKTNAGFIDGMPMTPGGFGNFLSNGAGEGFPPGERMKCNPAVSEAFILGLPQNVMDGANAFRLEPYDESLDPDLVICFATPDQLSALTVLHAYERTAYDTAITGCMAGCASIFRVPLGEARHTPSRAVIGNLDLAERHLLDKKLISFTVSGADFKQMLDNTSKCFFHAPMWRPLRKRILEETKI